MRAARSSSTASAQANSSSSGTPGSAPPVSNFSVAAVAPGRATPSDVVAALRGSASVRLRGFTQHTRAPSFLRPGVQFVSPSIAVEELRSILIARSLRTRIVLWASLLCTHVAVAAIAAMWWSQQATRTAQEQFARAGGASSVAAVSWSVVSVSAAGVLVRMEPDAGKGGGAGSKANAIAVPVGGRLPNGELLTLVDAARGMYVTPRSRTFIAPASPVVQQP